MSRSKYLRYNDEQLRVLLSLAEYGPLSLTDLEKRTGIKKGNLSIAKRKLISFGDIERHEVLKTRQVGRPQEVLALASPQILHDICIELVYRKEDYERKIDERLSYIEEKGWAEYCEIAGDENEVKDFMDNKYLKILKERLLLGAGTADTLEEVSYPAIIYWLSRLQKRAENIPKSESQKYSSLLNRPLLDRPMPCSTPPEFLKMLKNSNIKWRESK